MNKSKRITKLLNFIKITDFIKRSQIISCLFVFTFFFILFLLIYMTLPVVSSGDDHYFHFRFAERLLSNGFFDSFKNFKTVYFTNIANGEHLMYYNFIFYLVLIPFTFITPLFLAIKLYAIVILSLIGTIIYLFIKNLNIKYPFLWSIGFFAVIGVGTFWRLFLSRPFVFSPIIIMLLILAIHKKKYFWIFLLSFIPLFWHTATFFVPILVVMVYFLFYAFYKKEYLWKELLLVILGILLAILTAIFIDSGFFISIKDNLFGVLASVFNHSVDKINIIQEGNEVYPKNFFDLFNHNIILCLMFVSSVVIYALNFLKEIKDISNFESIIKSRKIIMMVFFVLSSVFIVAIPNISNRFGDFFIFFGWIFVILVYSELFSNIEFTKPNLQKFSKIAVIICLIYLLLNNSLNLRDNLASNGNNPEIFLEVGNYLSNNLKKEEVIFNLNWGWFPQLYYYAPEQNYVIGLEPKLTYLYSPKLYWLWQNIGKGYACETEKCPEIEQNITKALRNEKTEVEWKKEEGEKIANIVINNFQSHYIVSSTEYVLLNKVLNSSKRFEKVLNSRDRYFIYKVLSSEDAK